MKFRPSAGGTVAISSANAKIGAVTKWSSRSVKGLQVAKLPDGLSVEKAVETYQSMPEVEYAQPNYRMRVLSVVPNDALFRYQRTLSNTGDCDIDAPEAWGFRAGSSGVVVAIIDTGVACDHPDLAGNLWVNADEVPGNDADDDTNGYFDDTNGYDFCNNDSDPTDDNGHGTHVAGIIGAVGNNKIGVCGTCWDVSIMPIKAVDADGYLESADAIAAIEYAEANGADICNCSWGSTEAGDPALADAIAASDMLFVCAAGNENVDTDITPCYPASLDLPNLLSVGASDDGDLKTDFSNYGARTVDVFAPGEDVLSTLPGARKWNVASGATSSRVWFDDFGSGDNSGVNWSYDGWSGIGGDFVYSKQMAEACTGYHDNQQSYMDCDVPLKLSGAAHPWLRFEMGYSLEPGHDWALVGVWDASDGASGYHVLAAYSGVTLNRWNSFVVDLSEFAGQNDIYLWYGLQSDESVSHEDGYEGVWVDDVEVLNVNATAKTLRADNFSSVAAWSTGSPWTRSGSVGCAAPGSACVAGYGDDVDADLVLTNPIDLSKSAAALTFNALYDLEDGHDFLDVYAVTGSTWTLVGSYTGRSGGGASESWEREALDLSMVAGGEPVRIAFNFNSDASGSAAEGYAGAWIDDVAVTTTPWTPALEYRQSYDWISGTSMAAPHASGIAALLLARNSGLTAGELKSVLMSTVDVKGGLRGLSVSGGRVNAFSALRYTNRVPTAGNDSYQVFSNVAWNEQARSLLRNDADPDGDTLRAYRATDPAHGYVEVREDGSFTYTPDPDYVGHDSFTYTADDQGGVSNEAVVDLAVVEGALIENSDAGVTFGRFFSQYGSSYSGGSYTYAYSRAPFVGTRLEAKFTGNTVRWIGPKQPSYGMAKVYIDGVYQKTVDCYTTAADASISTTIYQKTGLANGPHTICIEIANGKNPASTNYVVVIDRFEVQGPGSQNLAVRYNELSGPSVRYIGGWVKVSSNPTYTESTYAYSYWPGARYIFLFTGTRIAWIGPKSYNYGRASVYIDGIYQGTISQYAPATSTAFRARVWESKTLASGSHSLDIRPLGTKDAASAGKVVVVDAIDLTP